MACVAQEEPEDRIFNNAASDASIGGVHDDGGDFLETCYCMKIKDVHKEVRFLNQGLPLFPDARIDIYYSQKIPAAQETPCISLHSVF